MNILFYVHRFPGYGGIETVTATTANLLSTDHGVSIVSQISCDAVSRLTTLSPSVTHYVMPCSDMESVLSEAFLRKVVIECDIDVLIYQDDYSPAVRILKAIKGLCKIVVFEHSSPLAFYYGEYDDDDWPLNPLRKLRWCWRLRKKHVMDRLRHRQLYEICDRYVLLSSRFFGEFRAISGLSDIRKLRALPNALSCSAIGSATNKKNEILFLATLSEGKGCFRAIKVWERICLHFPEWKMIIVGDGEDKLKLEKYVLDNKVRNVVFEGYKEDPSQYYARAKIYLLPTKREGWPLTVVEAQANGCVPIVFNSFSSVYDLINDNENGIIVPAFDLNKFEKELKSLVVCKDKWLKMSQQATTALSKFGLESLRLKWNNFLEELI